MTPRIESGISSTVSKADLRGVRKFTASQANGAQVTHISLFSLSFLEWGCMMSSVRLLSPLENVSLSLNNNKSEFNSETSGE